MVQLTWRYPDALRGGVLTVVLMCCLLGPRVGCAGSCDPARDGVEVAHSSGWRSAIRLADAVDALQRGQGATSRRLVFCQFR